MKADDPRLALLHAHLDLLLNLGEVCATHVVATLVDGLQGHSNCEVAIDQVYLLILMGYRSCYKRYMLSLLLKRGKVFNSAAELKAHSATLLLPMTCLRMNPYKMGEMRLLVPEKYQCDTLYAKPDVNVMKKVKDKKVYQA
jgi:hypothetical protein